MITETTSTPADITTATPPTEDTDTSRQLVAAATAIRDWQASRPTRIVDEALVKRFPALGSTKTYKRLPFRALRCTAPLKPLGRTAHHDIGR